MPCSERRNHRIYSPLFPSHSHSPTARTEAHSEVKETPALVQEEQKAQIESANSARNGGR